MTRRKVDRAEANARVRKMTEEQVLAWYDQLIETHEQGARELRKRREDFVNALAGKDLTGLGKAFDFTPVNVLAFTVNEVNNISRNGRLDLAVNHAAALTRTDPALVEQLA